jgi:hypothetical protein
MTITVVIRLFLCCKTVFGGNGCMTFFYFNFFVALGCSLMCETLKVFRLERGSSSNRLYCAQRLVSVCDGHTSAVVNGTKA